MSTNIVVLPFSKASSLTSWLILNSNQHIKYKMNLNLANHHYLFMRTTGEGSMVLYCYVCIAQWNSCNRHHIITKESKFKVRSLKCAHTGCIGAPPRNPDGLPHLPWLVRPPTNAPLLPRPTVSWAAPSTADFERAGCNILSYRLTPCDLITSSSLFHDSLVFRAELNGFWSSSIGSRLALRTRPVFVLGSYRVRLWAQRWDGNFRWGVNIYNFSWNPSNQRSRPVGPLNLLHNSIKSWFWPQLQFHVVVLIHKQLTFGHLAWTLNTLSLNLPALIHFVLP